MKKAIYTVVCGKYDVVNPVHNVNPEIDYICFTDEIYIGSIPEPWIHKIIDNKRFNGKDLNRYYKINVCKVLSDYDLSIYIDGNIQILRDPFDCYFEKLGDFKIAMYDHYLRKNILEEANACANLGLVWRWSVNRQINRYVRNGFSSNNLYEANVIFRRHSEEIDKAMDFWWNEYINGVKRDQISFTYSMHSTGVDITSLGKSDVRFAGKIFTIHHHKYSKFITIKRLFVRLINKVYSKML